MPLKSPMRKIAHQHIYIQVKHGVRNTTLCGRSRDGQNVEGEVTCKLCIRMVRNQHPRCKWIGYEPK